MEAFSENFKKGSTTNECLLCLKADSIDNESHMTECEVLIEKVPAIRLLQIRELYSTTEKINQASVRTMIEAVDARKALLEC